VVESAQPFLARFAAHAAVNGAQFGGGRDCGRARLPSAGVTVQALQA
jgi:hypothetical protein